MKEKKKRKKILALFLIIPMVLVSLFVLTACGNKKGEVDLRQNTYYCHYDAAQSIYHYVAVKSGNKFEYIQNKSVNPESAGSSVVSGEYTKQVINKKNVYKMSKDVEAQGTVEAYTISIEATVEDANTLKVSISRNGITTSVWTFENLDLDYETYYVNKSGSLSSGYSYSYLRFHSDKKVDYKEVTSEESPYDVDYYATGTYEKTVRAQVCTYNCSIYIPATDTQQGKNVNIVVNVRTNEILEVIIQGASAVTFDAWTDK